MLIETLWDRIKHALCQFIVTELHNRAENGQSAHSVPWLGVGRARPMHSVHSVHGVLPTRPERESCPGSSLAQLGSGARPGGSTRPTAKRLGCLPLVAQAQRRRGTASVRPQGWGKRDTQAEGSLNGRRGEAFCIWKRQEREYLSGSVSV